MCVLPPVQVRTLEKVLEQEFDLSRRPHDWYPQMDVDREDFIDLARVSKQIPGKSPSQVDIYYIPLYYTMKCLRKGIDFIGGRPSGGGRSVDQR